MILPDNDRPGEEYAADATKVIGAVPSGIEILRLPGLPAGGDVFDFIEQGHGDALRETIRNL